MTKKECLVFLLFFTLLLSAALVSVDDYGISWDEYRQRITGFFAFKYIMEGDFGLFDYQDRHYGTAFELPLIFIEKAINLRTFRAVFLMRHYATFLLFYFSCITFYFLSRRLLKSRPLAFIAVGMLVISPRLFSDAFYNSKDIVFMGMFIVSVYTMMVVMEKRTVPSIFIHAAASAYLVDIRVIGIIVPFFTLLWTAARFLHDRQIAAALKTAFLYLAVFVCLTILFWPYLWLYPLDNFVKAFSFMSRHPNIVETLYRGEYVMTDALPWHYLPVWMMITIPPAYLLCFLAGVIGTAFHLINNTRYFLLKNPADILIMAWFFGPIIVVTASGSTIYDAWRQLFFVYPAFVLIGVKGIKIIWEELSGWGQWRIILKTGLVFCLAVNIVFVMWFMIKHHPYGNVYFNILAGRDYNRIKNNFEMDYWGLAYRQALEKIVAMDDRDKITIFAANDPGVLNSLILPEKERKRLWYVKTPEAADYFITNYRWRKKPYSLDNEIFSVDVKGAKIVSVFKLDGTVSGGVDVGRYRGSFFDSFDDPSKFLIP